ncbi:anti-sigma factor domain-containing protein [Pseudobacteroides cellulosolvens]|uniref:anti-sigma factor domain-containing protein n=1 Tax=Pseudobacteroides cellulosolvens TaxID=35825 RepID=UPI00136496AF|nr:anti-sigma factor domain-containing protein [Pseudobacteroides cellulosolvens]
MNLYRVGYIFSILSSDVIIMTEDLEFYKIKRRSDMIELGQEISFSEAEIIPIKNRKPNYLRIGAIASGFAAAIILLFVTFYINFTHTSSEIYAYIDVDTNLSVRLNIDKENKVIEVDSNNSSTEEILGSTDFKNKSLSDALSTIVEKSKQHGFTTDSKEEYLLISASIKPDEASSHEQDLDHLVQNVRKDIKEMDSLNVNKRIIKVDSKTCKIATENNVSMGRYITYIESKSKGANLSIEDIREGSIGGIIKKADMADITSSTNNSNNNKQEIAMNQDNGKTIEKTLPKFNTRDDKHIGNDSYTQPSGHKKGINNTTAPVSDVPKYTPHSIKNTPIILTFEYPTPTLIIPTPNPTRYYPVSTPFTIVQNTPSFTNNWPIHRETNVPPTEKRHTDAPTIIPSPLFTPKPMPTFNFVSPVEIAINPASEITATSAFISGTVTKFEQSKGFYGSGCNISLLYWEASNPMHVKVASSISKKDFPADISATIKDLKPHTTYQFKVTVNFYFSSSLQTFKTLALESKSTSIVSTSTPTPSMPVKVTPVPKNPWVFPTPIAPPVWYTPPKIYMPQYTFVKPTDLSTPSHTTAPTPTPTKRKYHRFY